MATIGTGNLTLLDWAERRDPSGKTAAIVELLNQSNQILDDMPFIEGNLPVGHRVTVRTGLPAVAWRLLNQGVATSKSTTAQIDEQCGMLEAWSEVDKDVVELNGDASGTRMSESKAFLEAMNQGMATALFYGNSGINPEQFTGLAPRFATISGATNGQNIISAGSVTGGDGTSIWLVGWSPETVTGIFPKGSIAGIEHLDRGLQTAEMTVGVGGSRMLVYQERFQWKCGIAMKDWRYVVRIPNIDTSVLIGDTAGTTVKLIEYMARAIDRLPSQNVSPVFYMNRTVASILRVQALNKSSAAVTVQNGLDQFGRAGAMHFLGVPIRICDQLVPTETTVS